MSRPLRVAWVGPAPTAEHGVPYLATVTLHALAEQDCQLDVFAEIGGDRIPERLLRAPGLRFVVRTSGWQQGRWYSSRAMTRYASGQAVRVLAQSALVESLARRHAQHPYDVVYQFSQIEALDMHRLRRHLPPLVLHPQVHAAGELYWLWRERGLRTDENALKRFSTAALLGLRSLVQGRDLRLADRVIAASEGFGSRLIADHAVEPRRVRVVPNAVDLERFRPSGASASPRPLTLLFAARLAVRKGADTVVDLSHRISDLEGQVRILVSGGPGEWSDYSALLKRLDTRVAGDIGWREPEQLAQLYREVDAVIVASKYEPFGLVAAEALASGVPLIASDAVGAAEGLAPPSCHTFPAGQPAALERVVRDLVAQPPSSADRGAARLAACVRFSPDHVAAGIRAVLSEAARREAP